MSKNPRTKIQVKTSSISDSLRKTTSSSSSDLKKSPNKPIATRTVSTTKSQEKLEPKKPLTKATTTGAASASKDEGKKKTISSRTAMQAPSGSRVTTGSVSKPAAGKATTSRSGSTTSSTATKLKPRGTSEKQAPALKSKHAVTPTKPLSNRQQTSSKPNLVMSTVHNVTVSSPPSKRRELPEQRNFEKTEVDSKRKIGSSKSDETAPQRPSEPKVSVDAEPSVQQPVKVKQPVAFEVVFDETQGALSATKSPAPSDSSPDYEDDFESYESDFETGSSSADVASSSSSQSSPREKPESTPPASESSETEPEGHSEDDDESEITQFPITVIHRDKEQERKLDSGNYDLHSKKRRAIETFDSLDTLANYEQLDSGISYENSIPTAPFEPGTVAFCGYSGFYTRPVVTKRGAEIMSKIQFDMITFTLLDLKPIPYDTYMRMFGSFNTLQSTTQTQEDRMESECQTETSEQRSVWTQHPAQYDVLTVQGSTGAPICSGEAIGDDLTKPASTEDRFDHTLRALSTCRQDTSLSDSSTRHKFVNHERLNAFLRNASLLISRVLSSNAPSRHLTTTDLPALSNGFYNLNTHLLNALRVVRVFANRKFNLILTVHESIANVYQNDFSNLIMVWNSEDPSKPVRLLSTWSEVCQAEICNESSDIVVCGLRDGSVAMWDLRETYSFCSKLDGYLTHFAATHSIAPNLGGPHVRAMDLGAVIDVKSFRPAAKGVAGVTVFKTVQFASLNETGILTIWTLVETGARTYELAQGSNSKFEYSSPWARVKLIQSAICDLREFMEFGNTRPKSAFERTKLNFQRQIFDDDILKELADTRNDMKLGVQGLRFINLDCGTELIFVGTNRNYIISCSKTLKRERFRKLTIAGGGFLFPTAIKLLQNENFLAVGLSNGSVALLNCNQEETSKQQKMLQKSLQRRPETTQSRSSEFDFETGKSCAIQNIIRNERLPPERQFVEDNVRPSTAALIEATADGGKKPFELRVFDEQILLNGSVLRKDLVRSLEVSSDGWTLFALSNGNLRVYDFYAEKEVSFAGGGSPRTSLTEIAVTRGLGNEKKLVLLTAGNSIEVHLLK